MNYQADFVDGTVLFAEAVPSPPNLKHLQGAMFLDRPDLWPIKRRRTGKPVPPEQQPLFQIIEKGEVDEANRPTTIC